MVPGAIFRDYELTDHSGKRRKLSELQGPDPMILVLGRGGFCPKDRRQAEGLVQLHREMEVGYCRLVTISTDNLLETNENRTAVDAHWPFLSDAGRTVLKGSRHRRVHGSGAQSDDPAHHRARARADRIQDLQRILVLRPSDDRGASARPAGRFEEMPSGLGHHGSGNEDGLGTRRKESLLSLREELREGIRRAETLSNTRPLTDVRGSVRGEYSELRCTNSPWGTPPPNRERQRAAYLITFVCYGAWLRGRAGSIDHEHNAVGSPRLVESSRRLSLGT